MFDNGRRRSLWMMHGDWESKAVVFVKAENCLYFIYSTKKFCRSLRLFTGSINRANVIHFSFAFVFFLLNTKSPIYSVMFFYHKNKKHDLCKAFLYHFFFKYVKRYFVQRREELRIGKEVYSKAIAAKSMFCWWFVLVFIFIFKN